MGESGRTWCDPAVNYHAGVSVGQPYCAFSPQILWQTSGTCWLLKMVQASSSRRTWPTAPHLCLHHRCQKMSLEQKLRLFICVHIYPALFLTVTIITSVIIDTVKCIK